MSLHWPAHNGRLLVALSFVGVSSRVNVKTLQEEHEREGMARHPRVRAQQKDKLTCLWEVGITTCAAAVNSKRQNRKDVPHRHNYTLQVRLHYNACFVVSVRYNFRDPAIVLRVLHLFSPGKTKRNKSQSDNRDKNETKHSIRCQKSGWQRADNAATHCLSTHCPPMLCPTSKPS